MATQSMEEHSMYTTEYTFWTALSNRRQLRFSGSKSF